MQNTKWCEKSYRRNLIDMHIDDWDETFLSQLDPKTYVELLKKANVQSAMVYANSHVGYCNWPTKTGKMHSGLKGRDILGEITNLCHEAGMDVIAYYSLIFNNWAYDHDPSWRIVDIEGAGSRARGNRISRYGVCCPNNMAYRDFVEAQTKELLTGYKFEGIFFDMMFWPGICYCPSCKERFSREVGGEMPAIINWQDAQWLAFQKKREEWLVEFSIFAADIARKYQPGITVEHNSAPLTGTWMIATTLGLVEQNDYVGGDLYGGFAQQSFICKLYDSITPNRPFEFMTSRCHPTLWEHTAIRPKEMLELHTYLALAHNGAFLFIDAIDPVGTLNPRVYETMGAIFGKSKDYEPYLGGNLCQDVAIYFSLDSKMDFADSGGQAGAGGAAGWIVSRTSPHLEAALGAAKTLRENHIPFGVISKKNLEDTSPYQVIVLPNVLMLSEDEAAKIRQFVADGGSLYASTQTAPSLLADVFGVTIEGVTAEWETYMTPTPKGQSLFPDVDPRFPLSIFGTPANRLGAQIKAKALNQDEVAATLTLPYTDPMDGTKLASIHSNPPGIATDYASVVYRSYEKGKVIWVSAPLEVGDKPPQKSAFAQMVRALASKPFSFELEAPDAVELVVLHQPDRKRYLISLINTQEQMPPIPVFNLTARVKIDDKKPVRVVLLPDEKPMPFTTKGEYVEVVVPELQIFCMLMLVYE